MAPLRAVALKVIVDALALLGVVPLRAVALKVIVGSLALLESGAVTCSCVVTCVGRHRACRLWLLLR